jgi:hypothetical protein
MSRLSRTGLWLIGWLPLLIITMAALLSYDRSLDPCPLDVHMANAAPRACVLLVYTTKLFTAAFALGLLFLAIAGLRRLRSRRTSSSLH